MELLGAGDSVVGCGVFGAIVSLPKMPKPKKQNDQAGHPQKA